MSFIWPMMLVTLLAIPLCVLLYVVLQKRRRQVIDRFGSFGFSNSRPEKFTGVRRHVPSIIYLTALGLLLFSLARPQASVNLPRVEGTVMLLFDVSGSMAADDFAPTRMEAAKKVAREFVQRQPSTVMVGVVAFSTSGFAVQPPTNNQDEILAAIDRLSPQLGTSLGQGIYASLNALAVGSGQNLRPGSEGEPPPTPTPVPSGMVAPAVIVMLTDGENNQAPDPEEAAQAAADRGIRVYPVGIGSAAGALLKVNGFTVHTQLDETMMKRVAEISGGQYYSAENEEQLKEIYDNLIPQVVVKPEMIEITSLLAGASIIILVLGGMLSLFWFGRVL